MEERLKRLWAAYDRQLACIDNYQSMLRFEFKKVETETSYQEDFQNMMAITNAIETAVRTAKDLRQEAWHVEIEAEAAKNAKA